MRALRRVILENCTTMLGLASVIVVTLAAIGFLALFVLEMTGAKLSPYLGILTYMVLPGAFLAGLAGVAFARIRRRRAARAGHPLHVLDLSNPRDRERLLGFGLLTVVNCAILGLAGYHGVHYMDSTAFCGKVCHTVMEPEYTAYQHSPHARISCTDCHIGPGADWFVKAKISGVRQVLAVATHSYETPIPTPVQALRPARETCEQCHWPSKFLGDRIKVLSRYEQDEKNTELKTVLLLKVGGGSLESGFGTGIHWHVTSAIDYRSSPDRKRIDWIKVQNPDGSTREYWSDGAKTRKDSTLLEPVRRMDCIDCHNRPTHRYELPSDALDNALKSGRIASDLPFFKREAMTLLRADWPTKQMALEAFDDSLHAFYRSNYPEIAANRAADVDSAVAAMSGIYARNIFPKMKIGWGTYPTMIGHRDEGGCFRCHDEQHSSEDGKTVSQDCTTCHNLLAMEEQNPPILQSLYGSP